MEIVETWKEVTIYGDGETRVALDLGNQVGKLLCQDDARIVGITGRGKVKGR